MVAKSGLILVELNGSRIKVHPNTLEAHQNRGWMVVEATKKTIEKAAEKPAAKDADAKGEK